MDVVHWNCNVCFVWSIEVFMISKINRKSIVIISTIIAISAIMLALVFVILPMSAPHNPETIAWLNQAECEELREWIESKKGTFEKYQSTANGIYEFKECE